MAKTKKLTATAFRLAGTGGVNVVGVGNLRVMVHTEPDGTWIAQGLELDYTAEGRTIVEVQRRFEQGLSASLHANVRVFNHIKNLLRPAPADIWERFFHGVDCEKHRLTLVSAEAPTMALLPFQGINYYAPAEVVAK